MKNINTGNHLFKTSFPNPGHIYRGRKSKSIFQNTTVNVKVNQLKQKEKVAIDLININIDYSTTSNSY